MNNRRFVQVVVGGTAAALVVAAGATVVLDPFFHYHNPLEGVEYPLEDGMERYLNDGIIKRYDYDAAIVGTSMMQNFKASQFDSLFGTKSIKVTYTAETYYAIDQEVRKVLRENPDTKYIFRCLDYNKVFQAGEVRNYDQYPDYLYDDNILNDVNYVLNKEIFLDSTLPVIRYNMLGKETTSMDDYSFWEWAHPVGKEHVMEGYQRTEDEANEQKAFSEEDRQTVIDNVTENVIRTVEENPDTTFIFYTPPYSVAFWDDAERKGDLLRYFEAEKLQAELLLPYDNVKLYSFTDHYDITGNLDNYMDNTHYGSKISDMIIDWIYEGEGLLTEDNYLEKIQAIEDYYLSFDYDSIFGDMDDENAE